MNWSSFFSATKEITAEQLRGDKQFSSPHTFQLVDVRQPAEYEQEHIPGALLIPLAELPTRLHELNPQTETVVYCRSGARSSSACQILHQHNFKSVSNLTGGILSWNGNKVIGAERAGMEYFVPGEFTSVLQMAYQMEDGLQDFYLHLASETKDRKIRHALENMAQLEDGHKAKLRNQYPTLFQQTTILQKEGNAVEGGFNPVDFTSKYISLIDSVESILHLAMKMESQAYDLYSRLARRRDTPEIQHFFNKMADEELLHLSRISKELDRLLH